MLTYLLASTRNFICSSWSCSSIPVLVLILKGIFIIHESFFMVANVCFFSLSKALPPQVFITFLAGQPIFNSIHEKQNWGWRVEDGELTIFFFTSQLSTFNSQLPPYLAWMSVKHLINISSFAQNIWAMTGACSLLVKRCFTTPSGLMI